MTQHTATKVYLSADALFDLRLGTLITISPDYAYEISKDEKYFKRTSDIFSTEEHGALDREIYDKVFEAYKPTIIKNSICTRIIPFVASLLVDILKQSNKISLKGPLELDINLYPFVFTDEEANELLTLVIYKLGKIASVNLIYKPLEELTVAYVKENYLAVIMYRYYNWFNLHTEELKNTSLKSVGFYLPRINFLSEFNAEQRALLKKHGTDIFDLLAKSLAIFATVQYLPIAFFSADLPHNKPEMVK